MFWLVLFLALGLLMLAGSCYLGGRIGKFSMLRGKKGAFGIGLGTVAGVTAALWAAWGAVNALACVLHLLVFWLLCDGIFWAAEKIRRRPFERYYAGAAAVVLTLCCLAWGWHEANHVQKTRYMLQTEKPVGQLRLAMLSDAHVGTTFHGDGFAAYLEEIQGQKPDAVLIAGDFVDDDTARADMEAACKALGELEVPCGVYYVFGNHDKGYSDARGYSGEDLKRELEKNGVRVLEDEICALDDRFYLIGRADKSGPRADMAELTRGLDRQKYWVVLDHQPGDYRAEEEAGADLVLSGHTHGGQFFPAGPIVGLWNDGVYGLQRRGNTDFIVSSGISDWALKFRTGHGSEYVIVDIAEK